MIKPTTRKNIFNADQFDVSGVTVTISSTLFKGADGIIDFRFSDARGSVDSN
jgi:hypothetical protein